MSLVLPLAMAPWLAAQWLSVYTCSRISSPLHWPAPGLQVSSSIPVPAYSNSFISQFIAHKHTYHLLPPGPLVWRGQGNLNAKICGPLLVSSSWENPCHQLHHFGRSLDYVSVTKTESEKFILNICKIWKIHFLTCELGSLRPAGYQLLPQSWRWDSA